ncbi:hypothetical protein A6770_31160 [Nostoc minutum NIES-26]|uniref:histidine kinase n=1 Tax=Nostoc minutum NIES-26 TaxID=1844469 RepID=A0A367Q9A4_9NOSO|nr:hypothetical protein A6770_31160 [Nostoc minutum NIES-26]
MQKIPNQASDRLKKNLKKIMQLWEERARNEISAAIHQTSLSLQNSLPEYLSQIAEELSNKVEKTSVQIAADKVESTRIGNQHGHERASFVNYSLDQVILEYHILRQVLFQVMEEETPLEINERDIIINSIEQAVNDAATQFSKTLQDIQELFMVTLTHDLRGPMNVAKMGAQIIIGHPERTDLHINIANRIDKAINRLDSMIQDLLDASRIRAGQSLELNFEECKLDVVLRDLVQDLNFTYGERFIFVSSHPIISYCSLKEIRRMIENLAINAVKYGDRNMPITIVLEETEAHVKLTVHNKGNPIARKEQSTLFQQFRRAKSVENQKGWGLGLFLVKSITEAHQGIVFVESLEAKGTSFVIKLPKDPRVL